MERDKERASEEHVDGSMEMEEENQKSGILEQGKEEGIRGFKCYLQVN